MANEEKLLELLASRPHRHRRGLNRKRADESAEGLHDEIGRGPRPASGEAGQRALRARELVRVAGGLRRTVGRREKAEPERRSVAECGGSVRGCDEHSDPEVSSGSSQGGSHPLRGLGRTSRESMTEAQRKRRKARRRSHRERLHDVRVHANHGEGEGLGRRERPVRAVPVARSQSGRRNEICVGPGAGHERRGVGAGVRRTKSSERFEY